MKLLIQKDDGTVVPIQFSYFVDDESEEETDTEDIEEALEFLDTESIGKQVANDVRAYAAQRSRKAD